MSAPVAITGAGVVAGLGRTRRDVFAGLLEGRCAAGPAPDIESGPVPHTGAAQAVDLPADFAPQLRRESRYLRWAAMEAMREAGFLDERGARLGPAPPRCALAVGTTLHGIRAAGRWLRGQPVSELRGMQAPVLLLEALLGLGFEGPRLTTCAACASGLTGMSLGRTLLQSGAADLVLAGGYDPISEYASAGFASLRLVAAGPQRPFCRDREGLKVGEGYGLLVLERLDDAQRRGASILAVIAGVGETSDGHHLTQPHPEGTGAARAVRSALAEGGLAPASIGMIGAHATGTPANDAAEAAALRRALGDALPGVAVSAAKSHLGHTLGAAGAVELALSIEAMRAGRVPPLANVIAGEIEFEDLDVVVGACRERRIDASVNLSIGFGGSNAAVALLKEDPGLRSAGASRRREPATASSVAMTGVGIILPGIGGREQFLAGLGRLTALGDDPGNPAEDLYLPLLDARKSRRLSIYARLTVAAAVAALRDAGIEDGSARDAFCEPCDAILGTAHGSPGYAEAYYREIVESGPHAANPMLFAEGVPNAGAAQLSIALGLRGACQTILGTRTAGLEALHVAALRIGCGRAQRAIVVASEEVSPVVGEAYRAWRPASGRQFHVGGGAVALILESAPSLAARGGRALAWLDHSVLSCGERASPRPTARRAIAALAAVARRPGPTPVFHAPGAAWPSLAERRAAGAAGSQVEAGLPWQNAELFAVGPMAAAAAAALHGEPAAVIGVDFHGPVAAIAIRPAADRPGAAGEVGLSSPA